MWGELYARLDQGGCEATSSIAAVVAGLLSLVCISLDGWVAVAMMALLPMCSGVSICFARRVPEADRERVLPEDAPLRRPSPGVLLRTLGHEGLGILVASMAICYAGRFDLGETPLIAYQMALVCAVVIAAAVALVGILMPLHFDLQVLYRWMCPFVIASLACLVWFPDATGRILSLVGSISARLAFCLITQICFARVAVERGLTPTLAFALGWICLHLGDLMGVFLDSVFGGQPLGTNVQAGHVLGVVLALVASVMIALNGRSMFAVACDAGPRAASGLGYETPISDCAGVGDALGRAVERLAGCYGLTARETQVLSLLAIGRSNPYIRDELGVSLNTVGTHVKHIYAKLGVHSRQELIDMASENE